jgi:hypothetical protein
MDLARFFVFWHQNWIGYWAAKKQGQGLRLRNSRIKNDQITVSCNLAGVMLVRKGGYVYEERSGRNRS